MREARTAPVLLACAGCPTIEIISVVYTYWRYAQLKREQRGAAVRAA